MHLRKSFLNLLLLCGFSLPAFAHEAPVVDVQQNAVSTQPEESTSGGWQTVSNDSEPQSADAQKSVPQQQWVSASSSQPTEKSANNSSESAYAPAPSGSINQRVSRLEQQMANYNQMNLPQQVSDMQQKVSQMQGQLEVDQREIKTLTSQQKTYYQDIEQQITQLQSNKTVKAALPENDTDATETDDDSASTDNAAKTASTKIKKEKTLVDDSSTATVAATAPSASDTDAYNKAFRLLSRKHFNEAQSGFANYLKQYPKGSFAVNAHFWLGEIALMNQHYNVASAQFEAVVKKYPHSNKVSDAKLKIAMIHAAKGQTDLAKKEFTQIRKDYPGTTAAQLASIRLQQISGGMTS